MPDELSDEQWVKIDADLTAGRKIEAIKQYRELTGFGLKEAKDAVDARADKLAGNDPEKRSFEQTHKSSGCMPVVLAFGVTLSYLVFRVLS